MVNPTIIPSVYNFGDCPFLGKLIVSLVGNFVFYLPAIIAILLGIWFIKKGKTKEQKVWHILAGLLFIVAIGYRIYLNTLGAPLVYIPGCI